MWRRGLGVALSWSVVGCGQEAEAPVATAPEPSAFQIAPEPAGMLQEYAPEDRAALEAESVEAAPTGTPRAIAVKLSAEEWRRYTAYAVHLGSAAACSIDLEEEAGQVGRWLDRKIPPGASGHNGLLMHFARVSEHTAARQASGESGRSCSEVEESLRYVRWP